MGKKDKKIIENEPIVEINENENLVNEPTVENQESSKIPKVKKLICKECFTDKFDNSIVYKIGDELNITDVSRRNDLIERGLAVEK